MPAKKKEETKKKVKLENKNILLEDKVDVETIRNELKSYVDERVNQTFVEELEKTNKKIIREKSRRIIFKDIVIIILLLIIGFLLYLLFSNNYFDKYFNHDPESAEKEEKKEENNKEEGKKEEKKEEKKEPTLDELKKEYGSLLDNYYVTDSSIYLSDFYDGELTNEMMKYMTLNTFDFSTFEKEEDYNIIKESTFKIMYEKLFDEEYKAGSFSYDDNKIRYVKQMESYMSEAVLVRVDNNIKREIKNIKVDGDKVIITTVEGVVKDNKLFNAVNEKEVDNYKNDSLLKYADKLNEVVYNFKDGKLVGLGR